MCHGWSDGEGELGSKIWRCEEEMCCGTDNKEGSEGGNVGDVKG